MNNNKLCAKDFITIGIFTALLFVVEFACGLLGYIHPYIVASYVVMIPLVGSIPMMLFYSKIEKFGMLSIMSVLLAIIMFVTGMGYLGARGGDSAADNWIEQGVNAVGQLLLLLGVSSLYRAGLREFKLS